MIEQENKTAKDKTKWRNLEIQPRDLRLLTLLLHQKFLTLDQIHRSCYPGVSLQTPRMRLRKLRHFGLIQSRRVYTESRQIYLLAKAGYRYLEARGLSQDLGFVQEIDLRVFEHDRAVTDQRLALEPTGITRWKSERELRQKRPGARVSDALFELKGRTIALEFENADKGAERYRTIFLDHLDRPVAHHVLYVLRAEERLKTLAAILESLRNRRLGLDIGRISFAKEHQVLDQKLETPVLNLRQGSTKLACL